MNNNTIPTNSQKNSLPSNWTNRLTVQIINDLAEKYGEVVIGPGAKPNEFFLANLYFTFQKVIFEKNEGIFYKYDHTTGLWMPQNDQNICNCIHQFVREFDNSPFGVGLLPKMQLSVCKQVLEVLKGLPGCCTTFNTPRDRKIIHTQNTMLEYDQETKNWVSHPFAPEYMSRNRTEIPYVPNARPNQFISDLLQPALSQSDIDILQMYMGQILLGQNISQRILFITGTAGGGKSTLVNVIESLVSLANCTELRLDNSSQRFETSRYIGKTLLTAKDVHSLFLNSKLAHKLKALTGKDAQSVEFKGKNSCHNIDGRYNVIIVSNATMQLKMDNDVDAWRRRLLWIKYTAKPSNPIRDFDSYLIQKEGSGILNWALEGACKLLQAEGSIIPPPEQTERIDLLLKNSDPLRTFISTRLVKTEGVNMTTAEILRAFANYCEQEEIICNKQSYYWSVLPDLMDEIHKCKKRNDIVRGGRTQRGYAGIALNIAS